MFKQNVQTELRSESYKSRLSGEIRKVPVDYYVKFKLGANIFQEAENLEVKREPSNKSVAFK